MVTATSVSSGLFGSSYSTIDGSNPRRTGVEQLFRKNGFRSINELLITLIGTAAGGAALKQVKKVNATQQLNSFGNGGLITIDTEDIINRVSTSADITDLNLLLTTATAPATYVADASGNSDFAVGLGNAFTPGTL